MAIYKRSTLDATDRDLAAALASIANAGQAICNAIVASVKVAQLDPLQVAKIKDLAIRLQAVRDRNA
jgi:predicted ATPase